MEGNQMKMREALTLIVGYEEGIYACVQSGHGSGVDWEGIVFAMIDKAKEALSAPPRQCDVGMAEEQTKRFSDFCASHRHTDLPRCAGCPLENTPSDTGCSFAWAQTPCAEKGSAE